MAPESERAMNCECGHAKDEHDLAERESDCLHKLTEFDYCPCPNYKPTEPTLTCSEVVERLRMECLIGEGRIITRWRFDREKAEAILHSWRERRVQELEEALREIVKPRGEFCHICGGGRAGYSGHSVTNGQRCPIAVAEDALAKFGVARADQEGREA